MSGIELVGFSIIAVGLCVVLYRLRTKRHERNRERERIIPVPNHFNK